MQELSFFVQLARLLTSLHASTNQKHQEFDWLPRVPLEDTEEIHQTIKLVKDELLHQIRQASQSKWIEN